MPSRSLVTRVLVLAFSLGLTAQLHGTGGPDPSTLRVTAAPRELVVVFDDLPEWEVLAASRPRDADLLVLDGRGDGLKQLATHLRHRRGLEAIHVLSHGAPGSVRLGSRSIDAAAVEADAEALATIGASLVADGDLLLYGCKVAGSAAGGELLARLAAATGADVAASTDLTGAATLGGNWQLEARHGDVASHLAYAVPTYPHVLPTTLAPGDIVVLGWSAFTDTITLATLTDITSGTEIVFTDRGWDANAGSFTASITGDGIVTWTTTTDIDAGTVLTLYLGGSDGQTTLTDVTRGIALTAELAVSGYSVSDPMGIAGDGLFVYQGLDASPTFVFGLNNSSGPVNPDNWNTSAGVVLRDSMLPVGLINGSTAIGLPGSTAQRDHQQYVGPVTGANRATWLARVTNIANWSGDDAGNVVGSFGTSLSFIAAPVVTTSGGTTSFVEADGGASPPVVIDSGLTVSDPDNATLATATVAITGNFSSGQDVLAFVNDGSTMGNVTGSYNAATGWLTLTSAGATATLAQWQSALRAVTYTNGSDWPDTSPRTITFVVNDGTADSSPATRTVSVASVNDTPVISAPATIAVTEDVTTAITGISFSDVDAGAGAATATFAVPSGSMSAVSGSGVTVGGTSSAMTLTGTMADINAFVAASNVSFTTATNASSNVTLTVNVDDNGNTGAGGAKSDMRTVTLAVTAVNDAPVISAPATIAVTENVTTAITGIFFSDVDAGAGAVAATFAVPSGSMSAVGGSGVTVGGTSSAMTLTGTLADINAFIAAGNVSFTTAMNATSDTTLAVNVLDNGNTGTGGSKSDSGTVTLAVTAVNDAPVNAVPSAQVVGMDGQLTFGPANGNAISVSDVDAGGSAVEVTLTASNGQITLAATTGLAFVVGTGTGDAAMTFTGTIADINSALNGMVFSPTGGYSGVASLQITTNDQGWSGSGGAKSDADTVSITVTPSSPVVTTVTSLSADGTYAPGQSITLVVTLDQTVICDTAGGVPTLTLETGIVDRLAPYVSGSGTNALTFLYTIQAGDSAADLDYASSSALALNGATIRSASNDDADLTLPAAGSAQSIAGQHAIVIDGIAPRVTGVSVPAAGTHAVGHMLDFAVAFDENVSVAGMPVLTVALDNGGPMIATYTGGSGSAVLTFRGTVAPGQLDADGIVVDALLPSGATITDVAGNAATLTLANVSPTTGVLVDGVPPTIAIGAPSSASTTSGPVAFEVTYTGASVVTLDASHVSLVTTGSAAGTVSVSGTGTVVRTVTVSGISGTGTLAIAIASGTATDGAGNVSDAVGPSTSFSTQGRSLTAVTPTRGRAAGGVAVTLVGTGFTTIASPVVLFGTTAATQVDAIDDGHLRAVTPSLPAGVPVDVSVLDGSVLVGTLTAAYTPVDAPADDTTDSDQDGMPDTWELWFGLDPHDPADATLDPDNDGVASLDEFHRRTHPVGTWTRALAEGLASDLFATGLSMFNPGLEKASVVLHYLRDGNTPVDETIGIEPGVSVQRWAADVAGLAPAAFATEIESNVPLVATGLTSWDARAYGSGAETAIEPATTWYLAEGATHGPFDLFYLLANTHDVAVDVDVTFLRAAPAAPIVRRFVVQPRSRLTLWVNTLEPELAAAEVAAVLRTVGPLPIVVERAMYAHDGSGRFGAAGHRAAGVAQPATTWHLAEGYVGGPFDTYLLIANAEASPADVTIDVAGDAGVVHTEHHVVPGGTRFTRYAGSMPVGGPVAFTVRSTNTVPVVVERAMWWRGAGADWIESHASAGAAAGAMRWGLSGLVAGGPAQASTYLLVQNLDTSATTVSIAVYAPDGAVVTRTYAVAGSSRLTVDVGADFPASAGGVSSAIVHAATPIVVEASSYSNADGVTWSAGTNVRGTPLP